MNPLALYIHIPYCEHKCIYCDFYSVINSKNIEIYFDALLKEIKIRAEQFAQNHEVISIYFGGGTPTLVQTKFLEKIISVIIRKFKISENIEITTEANPGTLNKLKIEELLALGINRLSVGVQSFFDDDLKFLTRIHNRKAAIETVETANSIGFENINIDLIFNLPGQTKERWIENLETATSLPVKHISAYSLIVEHGTILYKMISDGKTKIGDEDYDADLYETTQDYLIGKGFEQYEVSNFAKNNYSCRHNLAYWKYEDYLGFGVSAHSFVRPKRWRNFGSLTFYLKSLNNSKPFIASSETLNKKEQTEEFVMLALRSNGLDLTKLRKLFGNDFIMKNKDFLDELVLNKFIIKSANIIKFTRKGYAVCDEILAKFDY